MDRDYDFESANAKFKKEDVAREVASAQAINGEAPSAATVAVALATSDDAFYDRGKSFFDNISCENKDRTAIVAAHDGTTNPNSWKRGEERKLNMETFGQASIDYGRGGFGRGGRGGRGGYRGGYGGRGGGAYYPRGVGRGGNPWRGGPSRPNGQNTSETTT
jgi:protein LSM14